MALNATLNPSNFGAVPSGYDTWFQSIAMSYAVSSAVSIAKGDFIKLASSTSNTITKCSSSADGTTFIGIALGNLDNSAGTVASDTTVGVLRKGIAFADILVASGSGTQKATVFHDSPLYLSDTDANMAVRGQAFTATANGQPIARSIDYIPVPTASAIFKGRVYIDTLLRSTIV